MRFQPSIRRTLPVGAVAGLIALGMMGCSSDQHRGGMALLAPASQNIQGAGAGPDPARGIELPFAPEDFAGGVQNPYFPLVPGTVYAFVQSTAAGVETDTVEVTHDTKMILGVTTTVVRDRVFLEGALKEDTFDWYASDKDGNVWYFGEDTKEIENDGSVSTVGSWEAGQAGAQAGIIMLAHPQVGDTYHQENAPGVVEDQARVKSLNETVHVPYGTFTGCIKTAEWTPIEPGNRAFKFYASGIGIVMEAPNHGEGGVELTAVSGP